MRHSVDARPRRRRGREVVSSCLLKLLPFCSSCSLHRFETTSSLFLQLRERAERSQKFRWGRKRPRPVQWAASVGPIERGVFVSTPQLICFSSTVQHMKPSCQFKLGLGSTSHEPIKHCTLNSRRPARPVASPQQNPQRMVAVDPGGCSEHTEFSFGSSHGFVGHSVHRGQGAIWFLEKRGL